MPNFVRHLTCLVCCCLLAGCGKDPTAAPVATVPATGAAVVTAGARVVSTGPALTLILTQIGATDSLVGVSSLDAELLPAEKRDLPVVGDYMTMNYEMLQRVAPTALLLQKAEDRVEPQLRAYCTEHHVEMVNARLDTVEDIFATARRLGAVSGQADAAEKQIAMTRYKMDRLRQRVKGAARPKVLYITGTNPIFVVGGERFLNDMIEAAGGDNVGATIGKDFPEVTREMILQLKPDVILISAPDEPVQKGDDPRIKAWAELPMPAAADGHIYLVTDPVGLMPSLGIAESAKILAKLIHPEINFDAPLADTQAATAPAGGRP